MNLHAVLLLLLVLSLAYIAYQDFRYRSVPVLVFGISFLLAIAVQYQACGMDQLFMIQISLNSLFIVLNLLIVIVYIKQIKKIPLSSALGIGDIVFYLILIPLLSIPVFMYFHISSLLLILTLYPILKNTMSFHTRAIPLAGLQACYLIILLIVFEYIYVLKPIVGSCSLVYWI